MALKVNLKFFTPQYLKYQFAVKAVRNRKYSDFSNVEDYDKYLAKLNSPIDLTLSDNVFFFRGSHYAEYYTIVSDIGEPSEIDLETIDKSNIDD